MRRLQASIWNKKCFPLHLTLSSIASAGEASPETLTAVGRQSSFNAATYLRIAILAVFIAGLYARVVADLADDWWNIPAYSQGILIPPLALLIAWRDRRALYAIPAEPDSRGLWLTALACSIYIIGQVGAEFFLPRISLVILLAGLILTFWGPRRLRRLALPVTLLATTIPLPVIVYNALAAPLQLLASNLATSIAQEFGVSAYRDGNIISLAHISLGVAEACSGLNSLSALMVASVLLGFLQFSSALPRWILFFLSIPLSIAVNIVRVTGTAILADYHEAFAMGFYHAFSGWLVFVAGFGCLYGLSKLLGGLLKRCRIPRAS